jgi:hypothetical protein
VVLISCKFKDKVGSSLGKLEGLEKLKGVREVGGLSLAYLTHPECASLFDPLSASVAVAQRLVNYSLAVWDRSLKYWLISIK